MKGEIFLINTNEIEHFLSNDLVFKIFFTKNKKLLKRLISMSIGIKEDKITKVKILNPILIGDVNSEKVGILDLLVEINNNQKINIEMQRIDKKNFAARIEYYMSKLYIKNLKRGESFSNLNEI